MENYYYEDPEQQRAAKQEAPKHAPIAPHFEGLILLRDHEKQETKQETQPEQPKNILAPVAVEMQSESTAQYPQQTTDSIESAAWRPRPEQPQEPAEEQVTQEAQAEPPISEAEHRRMAQDAWRRYWVDEHGREIAGATDYGQAYYQERQVETQPQVAATQIQQPISPTSYSPTQPPVVTLPPVDYQNPMQQQAAVNPIVAQPVVPYVFPSQQPQQVDAQHQLLPHNRRSPFSSPWLWLMAFIILAAFFATVFI